MRLAVLVFSLCFSSVVKAETLDEDKVSAAIVKLLHKVPNHKLRKNTEYRKEFSKAILDAAGKAGVPAALVLATAYRESTLRTNLVGAIGERGVMQLHGKAQWQYCRKVENRKINRKDYKDQLICGAHWLRYSIDICDGTYYQGISSYMTKNTCKPKKGSKLSRIVLSRLKLMQRINKGELDVWLRRQAKLEGSK